MEKLELSPSNVSWIHTHKGRDVTPLTRGRFETSKLEVFTQKAAVSHEASGLQRSRPKGSSSQTRSEDKTVKEALQMTSCTTLTP